MGMNAKSIKQAEALAKLLEVHGLSEVEVQTGSTKIRVSRGGHAPQPVMSAPMMHQAPAVVTAPVTAKAAETPVVEKKAKGHEVKSPMVGTFYLSASPDAPPFVKVGQKVALGDTLCLIEAMKTFNKINADKAGVIKQCCVENNQPVEFDQVLFVIES